MSSAQIRTHIQSDTVKNIIVDCDAGADGDDQFALTYAIASPHKVRVLAVCSAPYNEPEEAVAAGKAECEEIISAAGVTIPVYEGSPAFIRETKKPINSPAAKALRELVLSNREPIYAVITGCCTNVASALSLYPEIRDKLIVVWLALDHLQGQNNTDEYNYRNDIEAGKILFDLAENMALVCAGRVVAPYRKNNDEIDELFSASRPLPTWLRRRFREISWAQGLWDLCAEGLLIRPDACKMEISARPVFGEDGEIENFDRKRPIVVVNQNKPDVIIADAAKQINHWGE